MSNDYTVKIRRKRHTPRNFSVIFEPKHPDNIPKPIPITLEASHDVVIKRFPVLISEFQMVIGLDDVKYMRDFNNICGDCSVRVHDPAGFHYCKKSGLHVMSEHLCKTESYHRVKQFSPIQIYQSEFWKSFLEVDGHGA